MVAACTDRENERTICVVFIQQIWTALKQEQMTCLNNIWMLMRYLIWEGSNLKAANDHGESWSQYVINCNFWPLLSAESVADRLSGCLLLGPDGSLSEALRIPNVSDCSVGNSTPERDCMIMQLYILWGQIKDFSDERIQTPHCQLLHKYP